MKRILIALMLVLALCSVGTAQINSVILNIPNISATATKVPVNITDVTGLGVTSAEVVVVCNPADLQITGYTTTGALTTGLMTVFNNQSVVKYTNGVVDTTQVSPYSTSKVFFAFASATPIKGSGPLFYLTVKHVSKKTTGAMITYFLLNEANQFGTRPVIQKK
jgi:hypothetical protein